MKRKEMLTNNIILKSSAGYNAVLVFVLILLNSLVANAQEEKFRVYTFDIKEEIAPPVWRLTQKAFQQAKDTNADLVLIHMNTYGGMLESADSIRTAVLQSKIPVIVFIDNNAASAGALISIACDSIYMRPGANIGAATVVNQTGEQLPDKYQSYMRSMMRSTAEATGRDPEIAQAMVDPRIYIPGVSDSGKVLTFTTAEAIANNYCEGAAENIGEVLELAGYPDPQIIKHQETGLDQFIGFLISPFISGILIMVIIGGIYFELQSPGIGFPSAAALMAAILYFAPLYLEGLANNWEIVIFVVGVILIGVEIFAIPGFGIAGITGIALMIMGLTLSMVGNQGFDFTFVPISDVIRAFFVVIISIFVSILAAFLMTKKMLTTNTFGQLALADVQNKAEGYTSSSSEYTGMIGHHGVAWTVLRPSGKVEIGDEIYDATALSGYIDKGDKVKVIKYSTSQLFVRKVEE